VSWPIAVGLSLIAALLVIAVALKPADVVTWLPGFGIVAALALMAIGERRRRQGRTLWTGMSLRAVGYWCIALGVATLALGVSQLVRETYLAGTYNAVGGLLLLGVGLFGVTVLPNSTLHTDARGNSALYQPPSARAGKRGR
jgi:hypothetical protein